MIGKGIRICAKTGEGIDCLLTAIEENLPEKMQQVKVLLPFAKSGLAAQIRRDGTVLEEEYRETGLAVTALVTPALYGQLREYLI